jgi:phthalate 4,5-dioxygenase oxygenase subunit
MLTAEDNALVTKVGAGTPMGETLRRYWLPALLARELPEPDCAPVRLRVLGENLVGFRDTNGDIGILDENCPHRLASLFLGRNEESGLRCVYHGWKFDVNGNCVDQMNEPIGFEDKIKVKAYQTFEAGDVIWVYMGPADKTPPTPSFEYTQVPETHRGVTKVWQESNWLQALEGGIDSSHAPILHRQIREGASSAGIQLSTPFVQGGAPIIEVDVTDYGYRYSGVRPLGEKEQYVRGYHFAMPFTQLRPSQIGRAGAPDRTIVAGHHWVPIDDDNCMVWNWTYSYGEKGLSEKERTMEGTANGWPNVDPDNQYRAKGNIRNNWLIDRDIQRTDTFTGIDGINAQDRGVQESMGSVVDRTREHLGPADTAIIATRKLLIEAVRDVAEGGSPRGAHTTSYYNARAIEKVFDGTLAWRDVMLPEMNPEDQRLPVA